MAPERFRACGAAPFIAKQEQADNKKVWLSLFCPCALQVLMRLFLRIQSGKGAIEQMNYPQKPGFKAQQTAKAAAKSIEPKAKNLRERVYDAIKRAGRSGATADEVAEALDASILSVRPRVSELVLMNALDDTMQRRANKGSGRHAIVWRVRR